MTFNEMHKAVKEDSLKNRRRKVYVMIEITEEIINKFQESIKLEKQGRIDALTLIRKVREEHKLTKEFLLALENRDLDVIEQDIKIAYCDKFLPKDIITEEDITMCIKTAFDLISKEKKIEKPSMKNMGDIIHLVKELSEGAIEGRLLSETTRKFINDNK